MTATHRFLAIVTVILAFILLVWLFIIGITWPLYVVGGFTVGVLLRLVAD